MVFFIWSELKFPEQIDRQKSSKYKVIVVRIAKIYKKQIRNLTKRYSLMMHLVNHLFGNIKHQQNV